MCFAAESLFITKNKTERNFYIQKGERILLTNFKKFFNKTIDKSKEYEYNEYNK